MGNFALARLLLGIAAKSLLLSAVTSSMPACIIPVGPQWQDPDGIPNSPPQIISETPPTDMMVSGTLSTGATFRITAMDVNATDTLQIRWVVDGQPVEAGDKRTVPADSREPVTKTVDCYNDVHNKAVSIHPVRVVVGDRDFVMPSTDVTAVVTPGKSDFRDWWLTMDCSTAAAQQ